jgi:hypothetical protein
MGHSRQAQGTAPAEDSGYRVIRLILEKDLAWNQGLKPKEKLRPLQVRKAGNEPPSRTDEARLIGH